MDFVLEIPNNLSKEICEDIIKRYEEDDRKGPGKTLSGEMTTVKKSTDLHISVLKEWKRDFMARPDFAFLPGCCTFH